MFDSNDFFSVYRESERHISMPHLPTYVAGSVSCPISVCRYLSPFLSLSPLPPSNLSLASNVRRPRQRRRRRQQSRIGALEYGNFHKTPIASKVGRQLMLQMMIDMHHHLHLISFSATGKLLFSSVSRVPLKIRVGQSCAQDQC